MEVNSPIFKCSPYIVVTGKAREEDPLVHYLVIHEEYQVIEYETDILAAAIAWAQHFSKELEKIMRGETPDTPAALNVLSFNRPN